MSGRHAPHYYYDDGVYHHPYLYEEEASEAVWLFVVFFTFLAFALVCICIPAEPRGSAAVRYNAADRGARNCVNNFYYGWPSKGGGRGAA